MIALLSVNVNGSTSLNTGNELPKREIIGWANAGPDPSSPNDCPMANVDHPYLKIKDPSICKLPNEAVGTFHHRDNDGESENCGAEAVARVCVAEACDPEPDPGSISGYHKNKTILPDNGDPTIDARGG